MLRSDGIWLDSTNYFLADDVNQGSVFYDSTQQSITFTSDNTNIPVNFLHRRLINEMSTGVYAGGVISQINDTTFAVSSGFGAIVDNYSDTTCPSFELIGWSDFTSTSPFIGVTDFSYLSITSDATLEIRSSLPGRFLHRDEIILGFLRHPTENGIIKEVANAQHATYDPALQAQDLMEALGPINITGNAYGPDSTTLEMQKSAGRTHSLGVNYSINKKVPNVKEDSSQSPVSFLYVYVDGTNFTGSPNTQTVIDASTYNAGLPSSGDLTSVPDGSWSIQPLWFQSYTDFTILQYGQDIYPSLSDARASLQIPTLVAPQLGDFVHRGWLIVRGDATDLSNENQAKFVQATSFQNPGAIISGEGGESNTGQNVGLSGIGPFLQKSGVTLQFRNIDAGSSKLTVTEDVPNKTIDLDVDPSQIDLSDLGDVDATSPSQGDVLTWDSTASNWISATSDQFDRIFLFYADQLDNPVNSNWAVNSLAPLGRDTQNPSLYVRKFDDSDEEGVGWSLSIPNNIDNITIRLKSRAATAPGSSQSVALNLYYRTIPDNAAVAAWSSAYGLSNIAIPTNNYYQYDEQTIPLTTLGLNDGDLIRFELTRNAGSGSDTLSGDWWLIELGVAFS